MRRLLGLLVAILPALLPAAQPARAGAPTWTLDPATSVTARIEWQGKPIPVSFPGLSGEVAFDPRDLGDARATLSAPADAATTGNPIVDTMVRSGDYLAAAAHPTITFELERLTKTSKDTADVDGRITLRGVTRSLALKAKVLAFGPERDDPSVMKVDFAIEGAIDRRDFGSTAGVPEVSAVLPVSIRLVMTSR